MCNFRTEINQLISRKEVISFDYLTDYEKNSLAIETISDTDHFDIADTLLYRDDTFKKILSKFLVKELTGDQCVNRILDIIKKGARDTIDEIIQDEIAERAGI